MISNQPERLLAGPPLDGHPERFGAHLARLGELPRGDVGWDIIDILDASGLLGRGGAGFPTGCRWRNVAKRSGGRAVVVANGAEGEPASFKDRVLMTNRPHLVVDGAVLAADAIGADEIVFYVGVEHGTAAHAMDGAIRERASRFERPMRLVRAPIGYVAGEASAAVHFLNDGDARPTTTPPRASEHGVAGRPTLVQNVETLAYAALIARYGERWYRSAGRLETPGTGLITVSGPDRAPRVREIALGTTIGEIATDAGLDRESTKAVLMGGYFGTWAPAGEVWSLPLDPVVMKRRGLTFGCGILGLLPTTVCGVSATARIMSFMAAESAGQCGPCVFGLRAIEEAVTRIADGEARTGDLGRIEQLAAQTPDRGACHHPDGASQLMTSALETFGDEFVRHARMGHCSVHEARGLAG